MRSYVSMVLCFLFFFTPLCCAVAASDPTLPTLTKEQEKRLGRANRKLYHACANDPGDVSACMGTAVAAHDLLQDATLELEANRRACELGNATGCAFTGEARGKDGNIVQARELWAKCESDGRCATDLFWSYAIATPVDLKNADKYGQPACENGNDDVCRKLVSIGSAIDLQAVRQRQHDRQVESLSTLR